jgi:hypothetical protein
VAPVVATAESAVIHDAVAVVVAAVIDSSANIAEAAAAMNAVMAAAVRWNKSLSLERLIFQRLKVTVVQRL